MEKLHPIVKRKITDLYFERTAIRWQGSKGVHIEGIYDMNFHAFCIIDKRLPMEIVQKVLGITLDPSKTRLETQCRRGAPLGGFVLLDAWLEEGSKIYDIEPSAKHQSMKDAIKDAKRKMLLTLANTKARQGKEYCYIGLCKGTHLTMKGKRVPRLEFEYVSDIIGDKIPAHFIFIDVTLSQENYELDQLCQDLLKRRSKDMHNMIVAHAMSVIEGEEVQGIMCSYLRNIESKNLEKGIVIGKAEGRAEGKTEGRAEGREELKDEHIRKMIALSYAPEEISKITGVGLEELKEKYGYE